MMISRSQIEHSLKIQSNKVQPKGDAARSRPGSGTPGTDQIEISPRAGEIARIKEAIRSMPDERAEKVQAIAERIAQGTYDVDAADIAEMMLRRIIADRTI